MSLYITSHEEMQKIVDMLDQALYNHQQWYNELIRTLICRLPSDKHDLSPEAHKECRFGQWYYEHAPADLHEHQGFIAIGEQHQRMHQSAGRLLTSIDTGISPHEYDSFANLLERMRLEIYNLKRELEDLLYKRDPLTGAISRIDMLPMLREQQELSKRQNISYCLAMIDIDFFKDVNDSYGHSVGDQVLAAVARYIIEHVRSYDKVFRYGGEEFLILVQLELKSAYQMMEELRAGVAALPININMGKGKPLHITASFGLALLDPYLPLERSIDRADKAMYNAKTIGRNCVKVWEDEKS